MEVGPQVQHQLLSPQLLFIRRQLQQFGLSNLVDCVFKVPPGEVFRVPDQVFLALAVVVSVFRFQSMLVLLLDKDSLTYSLLIEQGKLASFRMFV